MRPRDGDDAREEREAWHGNPGSWRENIHKDIDDLQQQRTSLHERMARVETRLEDVVGALRLVAGTTAALVVTVLGGIIVFLVTKGHP